MRYLSDSRKAWFLGLSGPRLAVALVASAAAAAAAAEVDAAETAAASENESVAAETAEQSKECEHDCSNNTAAQLRKRRNSS